ncbi:DMT family transporter [Bradyrhizobium sp. LMTR 3]|uniref:DMT family transporter n=1 Tax=Bradyrhizobium sp. LMTR 3 TaxID=189873 RepID=UPI000B20B541|nr:DMT family transporter [Bradyrhizobium sp. LMTR 3]
MMRDAELKGIAYIAFSNLTFAIMSAIIKIVTITIPALEVSVLRNMLSILFLLLVLPRHGTFDFRFFLTKEHFLRSLFGYTHFVLFILCVSRLPLAAVSAISYTSPIWSLLFSVFVLKERTAVTPIIGLIFGVLGMLAVVQPSVSNMTVWIVVGLAGAVFSSLDVMMVRRISGSEAPERIALSLALWSCAMGLPLAVPGWVWPPTGVWPLLILIGGLGMLVQVTLTRGYTLARLGRGAPFGDFIGLPASLTVGWLCFAEFPTPLMWLGVCLILFGSSIALVERRFGT